MRSLAAVRRAREKERRAEQQPARREKIVREVVVPEMITVGELANRMAERECRCHQSLDADGHDGDHHPIHRCGHGRTDC